MEFPIEVTNDAGLGSAPAPPSAPTALQAAEKEYAAIMTDAAHPLHDDFTRGGTKSNDYINTLFRKSLPDNKPVESRDDGVLSVTTDFAEDTQAQAACEADLRAAFGEGYDTVMREMGIGAKYLFDGEGGQETLTFLSDRLVGLGPKAEALGIKFLAELSTLQSQGGRQS